VCVREREREREIHMIQEKMSKYLYHAVEKMTWLMFIQDVLSTLGEVI
jgi:hypothetical protein